jgi:hypothetical protein
MNSHPEVTKLDLRKPASYIKCGVRTPILTLVCLGMEALTTS